MKKIAATLLALVASAGLYALPLGNPWDASLLTEGICMEGSCVDCCDSSSSICDGWSFRFGFYGDYVFDRHMRVQDSDDKGSIHDTEIYTNAFYWAVNFCNRVDLFGTLGQSKIEVKKAADIDFVIQEEFPISFDLFNTLETATDFSWSLGIRASLWECGCWALGGEFQYFQTRPDMNNFSFADIIPFYLSDVVKYSEYQVGFGLSYRIYTCGGSAAVPYIGVKFSDAKMDFGDIQIAGRTLKNFESERYMGMAVGVTFVTCDMLSVTAEGRFFDEKAFHTNMQIRF